MFAVNRDELVWRKVDSEMIILNLEDANYFTLNEVGSTIWDVLTEGGDDNDATKKICENFAVEEASARSDVTEYIGLLLAEGLITRK